MKQLVPHLSIRNLRIFSACLMSLLMLMAPLAPLAAESVNRTAAAHAEQKAARKLAHSAKKQMTPREALENALFVNPLAQKPSINVGPNISATLQDSFVDTNATNRADPGSTVTYTAVVSNTGSDASGVTFTDTPDPNTTLVGGSVKVSPLAFADTYGATINTPLSVVAPGVLTNDTGTPAPSAVAIVAGPTTQGGMVTLNANGSFTYNPPSAVFTGADTFTYSATNGQAPNDSATVTINVGPANANPVANDDTASATEAGGVANGTAGTNPAGNLVTGTGSAGAVADTDAEDPSSALVVVQVHTGPEGGSTGTGVVGSPLAGTYGSLTLNSNGSYTYTVDNNNSTVQALRTAGQSVQDIFNYTIQDTGAAQDTATFTVTITGANDNPTAVADTASATEASGASNGTPGTDPGGNVLTNDTDVDSVANGETKTVQGVAAGTQAGPLTLNVGSGVVSVNNYGTLTIAANGTFTYVVNQSNATVEALNTGGTLTDTFSYTMKDAVNANSTTTMTVTINGADDNPVAVADSATVLEDALATAVPVLTNDTDVDGGPKSISSTTQPANGAVVITGGGTGLTYLPSANYCNHSPGATFDTFNYTLNGGSSATVSMTVTCVNDPPVNTVPGPQSVADTGTLTFSSGNSNQISVADVDAAPGNVQVTVSVLPTKGTLSGTGFTGNGTNSITITNTLANVNTALNGVVYTPPAGTTQAVVLTVLTSDLGNTGTGGTQTDSDTVTINVA